MTLNQKSERLSRLLNAAQGRLDCDLVIKGAKYLDVFSCEWRKGDISILDGTIVALEPGFRAKRTIEGGPYSVVPGFVDAHVHLESSLLLPQYFQQLVLRKGTTTAICDPHELANVMGLEGIRYFLDAAESLVLDLWVMLSSCVPATDMETNGRGVISASDLASIARHPRALGLAEMMNVPGVLSAAPEVVAKLGIFDRFMDGHSPLLRGRDLSTYVAAGISSCHEASCLEEAREKIAKGMSIWIREGSVAKDLAMLIPLLNPATSPSIGFCTDDRNPLDIKTEGHLDHLLRMAIGRGAAPELVYKSASWSPANHYGLNRGPDRIGAVAPGYRADLVLLREPTTCAIADVIKSGRLVSEMKFQSPDRSAGPVQALRAVVPESRELDAASAAQLKKPPGPVHVIGIEPGKIITQHLILPHDAPGVAKLSVLERHGKKSKPANGYVLGFGANFRGAIASSVGHDSHNLIVVGQKCEDMRTALSALIEVGGGFCVVQDGFVLARLELPFGGLMSMLPGEELIPKLRELKQASQEVGCELPEPFLQLAFLSLPVIPHLKLTDRGLVDVDQFKIIDALGR